MRVLPSTRREYSSEMDRSSNLNSFCNGYHRDNTVSQRANEVNERSRFHTSSAAGDDLKQLSNGKIVGSRQENQSPPCRRDTLGGNTYKPLGSQSFHTPPTRMVRDCLEFPSDQSSERTLSNSNERRSALKILAQPDLRDSLPRNSLTSKAQDQRVALEGRAGSSPVTRISTTSHLQETEPEDTIITIPPFVSKSSGNRRTTRSTARRVSRSPLASLKLKRTTVTKSHIPSRKKLCTDRGNTVPF
ncbi:hypothetical protein Bca52824_017983 [Brassica carinata]|uniref:Uncharacterized protein n=1 Tax=Brassica carinata TaxID=52824 RepID=A0A8X7VP19_BRACI|nr:hypothetical protein Bca52824_017983 [Brassica carinata]